MSAPALGVSGLSMALGLYNTTQIASLKEALENISGPGLSAAILNDLPVDTPRVEEPQMTEDIVPLEETSFSESNSSEIVELQDKLSELERFSNKVSTRSITNTNNVTIKGDELNRLSSFVTEALVAVRERTSASENSIMTNLASINMNESSIEDLVENIREVNERVDLSNSNAADADLSLGTVTQRMDAAESNAVQLSSNITQVVLNADELADRLDLIDGIGIETKTSLENLYSSWNTHNAIAFVADGTLNVTNLKSQYSYISLKHQEGNKSAIHFNSTDNNWSMYMGNSSGKTTDNKTPQVHNGINTALRMRLGHSSKSDEGFIIEDSSGAGILSLSNQGNMFLGNGRISNLFSNASFGHKSSFGTTGYAIIQNSSGKTQINSASGQSLNLCNNGGVKVSVDTGLNIFYPTGTNDTHFNYQNKGNNYIRSSTSTFFSFLKGGANIVLSNNSISVGGKELKSSIEALEARVAALESKNYVLHGSAVRMQNQNNGKYVRKSSSNNDVIADNTDTGNRGRWNITLA